MVSRVAGCLLVALAGWALATEPEQPMPKEPDRSTLQRYEVAEVHMGTQFRIVFYAGAETDASAVAKAGFDRIAELDRCMSDYSDTSELTRLCRLPPGQNVEISTDLWTILAKSQYFARLTDGAFDATCGPAVRLWRRARRLHQLPTQEQIAGALERVGHQHLEIDPELHMARLAVPKMQLDLGGIAKGYACDEALEVLKVHGVASALIDGGGGLALGSPPPGTKGWTVNIASPQASDPKAAPTTLLLHHCGVATSGDAEQFIELEGKRYSHIVDPKTGVGLTSRIQATVIASNGTDADALATAVCVLGVEKGIKLIDGTVGTAARVLVMTDEGPEEHLSREWKAMTGSGKAPEQATNKQ